MIDNARQMWHAPWAKQTTVQWLLVFLLLLSFGLRVHRLENKSVWWDEGSSVHIARRGYDGAYQWSLGDTHPPGYFWALNTWRFGSGDSAFSLRFSSVLLGVLTVALAYQLGRRAPRRRHTGVAVGLLAALLLTVSRFHISWSQEIRMYVPAALLFGLGVWFALRFWDSGRWLDGALYVTTAVIALHTLYLSVLLLAVTNVAWLWQWWQADNRWRETWRWGGLQLLVLLLFGPWLSQALGSIPTWSAASDFDAASFLGIYWTVYTVGIPLAIRDYLVYTLPVLAIFLVGLVAIAAQAQRRGWRVGRNLTLFALGFFFPAAFIYVLALPRDFFYYTPPLAPRFFIIFITAYVVLLAWGVVALGEWVQARARQGGTAVSLAAAGLILFAAYAGLDGYYRNRILIDDYRSLASTLNAYEHPNDAVVLLTDKDYPIFSFHHPRFWYGVPSAWTITPETAADYLRPIWETHDGVWLVVTPYAAASDPQSHMSQWLGERAHVVLEYDYGDKALRFYARTNERAATAYDLADGFTPERTLDFAVADGVTLVGYEAAADTYKSGDTIHLFLYWFHDGHTPIAEAEIGLRNENGRSWQWQYVSLRPEDKGQTRNLIRQQVDLRVPPDTPAGDYTFYAFNNRGDVEHFGDIHIRLRQQTALTTADVDVPRRVDADFANGIRLLGYELETTRQQPGEPVRLTLYWQAQQVVDGRYKVFTHLLGTVYNAERDNFLWGQQDNEPVANTRPTLTWRPGEVIVDSYAIPVAANAPAGEYQIEIGLYDPVTGERLAVLDDAETAVSDHLILTSVTVTAE